MAEKPAKPNSSNATKKGKLSLFDAVGMAVGGMVGGGIFAVLGTSVAHAGNAAFLSFLVSGVLALVTGLAYSRLTLDFDAPGGSFLFVEKIAGPRIAGTVSWFLLLGYVFTISLYAYTFGSYGSQLIGLGESWKGIVGGVIVFALAGLNLVGVRESGLAEDILVYTKLFILLAIAAVGFLAFKPGMAFPVFSKPVNSLFVAGALVFVAYEGFELLAFDYDDIADHHRNLPHAIWISISVVAVIYVLIAFVSTGTLDAATIRAHKETVLAYVAEPILGRAGHVAVLVAAVFSTASAINATVFATGRLAKRVAKDHQLPSFLIRRESGGVPVVFVVITSAASIAIQYVGRVDEIAGFASLVFLLVFGIVNLSAIIHGSFRGWLVALPALAGTGCFVSAGILVWTTWNESRTYFWAFAGLTALMVILRLFYIYFHSEFLEKKLGLKSE